jgi:PhnB protein
MGTRYDAKELHMAPEEQMAAGDRPSTTVAPSLVVGDGRAAASFYENAFGAVVRYAVPDGGVALLAIDGATFWLAGPGAHLQRYTPFELPGRSVWMILTVDDPDAMWARAVAAGATPEAPVELAHGWRVGSVVDPFGHRWEIGRPTTPWPPGDGDPVRGPER